MIQLIASDVDGTLVREKENELDPYVFEQIRELGRQNIPFCIASGRPYSSLRRLFEPVADQVYFLCENGAIIFKKEEILTTCPVQERIAQNIADAILQVENSEILISGANVSYIMPKSKQFEKVLNETYNIKTQIIRDICEIPEPVLKLSIWYENGIENLPEFWKDIEGMEEMNAAVSGFGWMDFNYADKGKGITALCQKLQISTENVMAFGDNFNDITMLEQVGHPYLMNTADKRLRDMFESQCESPEQIIDGFLKQIS